MAQSGKKATFWPSTDKLDIGDASAPVELYHIAGGRTATAS